MMRKVCVSPRRTVPALVLALCLLVPLGLQVSAASPEERPGEAVPYYIGTATTSAAIEISDDGEAACWGHIDCYWGYTTDAAMRLQWKNANGVWIDYKSWYDEGRTADFDETWTVPRGRTYRVRVIGDVFDEDGNWVEMVDAVSGSIKYY